MSVETPFDRKNVSVILVAVIMWGLTFPLIKIALEGIPPLTLGLLRSTLGLIPIALFTFWKDGFRETVAPLKKDILPFVGIALTQFYLPLVCQNVGMTLMAQETAASLSSILQATAPIFTIFFSALFLGEYIGKKKAIGTAIALSGTLLLVTRGGVVFTGMTLLGNLLLLGSAVFYALSGVLVKKGLAEYDPLTIISLSLFISTILFLPTSLLLEPVSALSRITVGRWAAALYLGLFGNGIALILWYVVLKTKELSKQILFVYLIPFLGIVFSNLLVGELIGVKTILLAVVIITGITIAQMGKEEKRSPTSR